MRFSSSLWVHGSRTSALMSVDHPCNCGEHIPLPPCALARTCARSSERFVSGVTLCCCAGAAVHCAWAKGANASPLWPWLTALRLAGAG